MTKPGFRTLTKIQLHFFFKTSAAKYWPASNLAWTSTSKSWPNLVLKVWTKGLWPNPSSQICNKLLPTRSSSSAIPPIWTTCKTFSDVEIQDLKDSLGLKILYALYVIFYIYNLKNSLKFTLLALQKEETPLLTENAHLENVTKNLCREKI